MSRLFLCVALTLLGCGGVAKSNNPSAIYEVEVVDATTYAAAEAHFAGGDVQPAPSPFTTTYWSDERCQELLDKRDAMVAATAGICGLTGASGLGTVIPEDASKAMRLGFGITTVALGTVCTSLTLASRSLTARFEQYCSTVPPPAPTPVEHPASDEVEEADGGVK
jgi:hypothetical protein